MSALPDRSQAGSRLLLLGAGSILIAVIMAFVGMTPFTMDDAPSPMMRAFYRVCVFGCVPVGVGGIVWLAIGAVAKARN